jgi:hypothetical protein
MKNIKTILCLCITFLTISTCAQLKVNSSGKIGIGGWEASNSYEIKGNRSYFSTSYTNSQRTSYSYVYQSMGVGTSNSSEYTLAVSPTSSVQYAMYISDGYNRSRGATLYVNGDAVFTQGWSLSSDKRLKKKERRLQRETVLSKLRNIKPKRYEYKMKEELLAMHNAGQAHFPVDTIFKTKKIINKKGKTTLVSTNEIEKIVIDVPIFKTGEQYGLAAQEVLLEYPELVTMDDTSGMYSVNYSGFIPILIEGFNAQHDEINALKDQLKKLENLEKQVKKLTGEE